MNLTPENIDIFVNALYAANIVCESGLTNDEVICIEEKFSIQFPPDLRLLLQTVLPVADANPVAYPANASPSSSRFMNWRRGIDSTKYGDEISGRIGWPLEGMLFDVEHNALWLDSWGVKPDSLEERLNVVADTFATYPQLIPVFSHRYIPNSPLETGNPIFSVYQTDIIYYGRNLIDYFSSEFSFNLPSLFSHSTGELKKINFWSWWVEEGSVS